MAAASQLYQKLDVGFADEGATQCERAHNGNIRQAQRAAARTVIHNGRVRVGRPIAPVLMLNSGSDAYNAVGIPSNEYNTVDFPSDEHNAVGIPSQRREGGAVRCARGGAAGVAEQQQQQRQKGGSYHVQNHKCCEGGKRVVHLAGEAIGLELYPRLMTIITVTEDLDPQLRRLGWVLRLMDKLYDSRRRAEQASFAAEEDHFNLDAGTRRHVSFPGFAYKHFMNRHGIKLRVRSVCLDLVCNVHIHRRSHPEVEVFARFLEEFYGQKELLFFLDMRAEVQRVTRVYSRRQQAATETVWMSHADCVRVAKGVFLDTATLYFRDLIDTVEGQMTGPPRPSGKRRISMSDFLYLAMVCFTSPEEPHDRHRRNIGSRRDRSDTCDASEKSGGGNGGGSGMDSTRGRPIEDNQNPPEGQARYQRFPIDSQHTGSLEQWVEVQTPVGISLEEPERVSKASDRRAKASARSPDSGSDERWREFHVDGNGNGAVGSGPIGMGASLRGGDKVRRVQEDPVGSAATEDDKRIRAGFLSETSGGFLLNDETACAIEAGRLLTVSPMSSSNSPTATFHVETGRLKKMSGPSQVSSVSIIWDDGCSTPGDLSTPHAIRSPRQMEPRTMKGQDPKEDGTRLRRRESMGNGVTTARDIWLPSEESQRVKRSVFGDGFADSECIQTRTCRPDFSATHGDGAGAAPMQRQAGEQREEVGARVGIGGVKEAEGVSYGSKEPSITAGGRESCDADLVSVGETTYASAKDGEGLTVDELNLKVGAVGSTTASTACEANPRTTVSPLPAETKSPRTTARHQANIALSRPGRGGETFSPSQRHSPGLGGGWRGEGVGSQRARPPGKSDVETPRQSRGYRAAEAVSATAATAEAGSDARGTYGSFLAAKWRQATFARESVSSAGQIESRARDDSSEDGQGMEIRTDVLTLARDWFAAFERRFLPRLAAKNGEAAAGGERGEGNKRTGEGFPPRPIARILSEEMVRILAVRRRDLHAVARDSPGLLHVAVAEAFWVLDSAVSNAATHSLALSNMGRLLEDRGNPEEALRCFEEASVADTTSAEARALRAANLQRRGDLDEAGFYFEAALARDECQWSAWYGLGQVKAAQGRFEDAIEAFSMWVRGDTTAGGRLKAQGLVQLGDAQRALGQDEQAQRSYELAVSTDKGFSDAYVKLGSLLQARGGHETQALETFAESLEAYGRAVSTAETRSPTMIS